MTLSRSMADSLATQAVQAIQAGASLAQLDQIPVAAYATDRDGVVTYFNSACSEFAGRDPQVGTDRWCVTWKLYTTEGSFLPHDQCPMAEAISTKRPVRGVTAVAERPDGTRIVFAPFPSPLMGAGGELIGAINILLDVTRDRITELCRKVLQARRLASASNDRKMSDALFAMADEWEKEIAAFTPSASARN